MRRGFVTLTVAAAIAGAACGEPAATNAPIVLRGALSGTLHPGAPGSCGTGWTNVQGQYGPDASRDVGVLGVSDWGSITFAPVGGDQVFSGHGVAFRQGSGWDIDADLHGPTGSELTITGHLPC